VPSSEEKPGIGSSSNSGYCGPDKRSCQAENGGAANPVQAGKVPQDAVRQCFTGAPGGLERADRSKERMSRSTERMNRSRARMVGSNARANRCTAAATRSNVAVSGGSARTVRPVARMVHSTASFVRSTVGTTRAKAAVHRSLAQRSGVSAACRRVACFRGTPRKHAPQRAAS